MTDETEEGVRWRVLETTHVRSWVACRMGPDGLGRMTRRSERRVREPEPTEAKQTAETGRTSRTMDEQE